MALENERIIAETIDYLVAHADSALSLDALARRAGYEATHFQKLFKQKVGLSPRQLQHYMAMRRARDFLLDGYPTLQAAYEAGLSGNGRLHDMFVMTEGATPGEVKGRGAGLSIHYGYHPTVLGEILVGATKRGVCWLGFTVCESRDMPFQRMREHWPMAEFVEDEKTTAAYAEQIMQIWRGQASGKLRLDLFGSNFQIQVWQALLKIPCGATVSYQDVANHLNRPTASRAVGTAVGKNPISLLIPCHRVIQQSGIVENYGWGTPRKKFILGMERAHSGAGDDDLLISAL
jgi:AraC family transcriptional regulator of adaptative response/methylated-DNA-[protein]-cysteine methyltransferase